MRTKFTSLIAFAVAGNKRSAIKKNCLHAILFAFLSCYFSTGYTQAQNNKPANRESQNLIDLNPFRAWLLKGNSGTNPSKNFIGTTDAQPLLFRVNNQKAGYLDFNGATQNTAFGYQTLNANIVSATSDGTLLSAFGWGALSSNTAGFGNTAHGAGSLFSNTIGSINTGVGSLSLFANTTGEFNTATGFSSLSSNTEGGFNTATGGYALGSNTRGSFNLAMGTPFTLAANTEGSENIATGPVSMSNNSTGNANVAYGVFSLATNETGSNNTALGSHADVTAVDLNNATAIGAGALVDASNKVRIGNTEVTSIGGEVGWTSYSDERIKDNIKENVPGLDFIKALRPVTYHFSVSKQNKLLGIKGVETNKMLSKLKDFKIPGFKGMQVLPKNVPSMNIDDISPEKNHEIEKVQFTGFLAQDVEKAAKNIGYDFSGVDKTGKVMGLRYSDFVVPLVKAVQELSKQNEDLQKQIDELKAISKGNIKTNMIGDAGLEQNVPNPFNKSTTIGYTLPQRFSSAQIIITDVTGKVVKRMIVSGPGKGTVNMDAAAFPTGVYNYSLVVDQQVITSKKMMFGR